MSSKSEPFGGTIREARIDERERMLAVTLAAYAEYAEIMSSEFWEGYRENIVETIATSPATRLVAEEDGTIVGSVLLYPADERDDGGEVDVARHPEIRLLAVIPAARGRGIARQLMRECLLRARGSGATTIGLHSMDPMRIAIAMYERMGFIRNPSSDFEPGAGILVKGFQATIDDLLTS